jgi:hypothetical protein
VSDASEDRKTTKEQALAAEGERASAELKHQFDKARALVREAKVVLQDAEDRGAEGRSFAGRHGPRGVDN